MMMMMVMMIVGDEDDDDDDDDDDECDILCWKKNALLSSCEDFDHTLPLPTQS